MIFQQAADRRIQDQQAMEEYMIREEIQHALIQWQNSVAYYNAVSDPELVDYASYQIEACRRKYEYLLRKIRSIAADNDEQFILPLAKNSSSSMG